MPEFNPLTVAKWVESRWMETEFYPLFDVINSVLTSELHRKPKRLYSVEEIAEWAESLVIPVSQALVSIHEDYEAQGIDPSFIIDCGDYFYLRKPSQENDIVRELYSLSPKGFECFCAKILEAFGASPTVSGGTNDQCVDFYAIGVPLLGGSGPFPMTTCLNIVGQAKKWDPESCIKLNDLRQFVGGTYKRIRDLRQDYDKWGLLTPVILAFWVTCDFHQSAREYAEQMGIWYLNGKAVAQLALRNGLTIQDIKSIHQ